MKILLPFLLLCCSCTEQQLSIDQRQYLGDRIAYYKDPRTELCFAGMAIGGPSALLTNVPCTPRVEELAKPFLFTKK